MDNAMKVLPELRYASSVSEAAEGAHLVLHLTEWPDYRAIDPVALAEIVARPVLVDTRCVLNTAQWSEAGWSVLALGRPS
jgi:UDPglucose 6-dehydrogenase